MKRLTIALALWAALPLRAVELPVALQAALASDPTLASAAANRDAAFENIALARARLLPQVSAQGTAQHLEQTTTRDNISSRFSGPARSAQLTLRQGVYRPRDWAGMGIARRQAEVGELRLASAESELWNRTTAAWIDVLVAQSLRDLYARTLKSVTVAAEQERQRFRAGAGTRDAVAEAVAQDAAVRSQLVEAELTLQARLQAFNLLTRLGVAPFEGHRLPVVAELGRLLEPEQALLERILAANPELAAARAAEAVSEGRVAQARADHWPTLDVVGAVNRGQNDTTNTLGVRYNNTQLGAQLVVPIFAGGGVSAAQRQASALYAAAQADREAVAQRLRTQFSADWNAQEALHGRAEAALELVHAANEQRRAVELSIKKGLKTWADLGNTDQLLARRESDRMNIVGLLLKTQVRLISLLPVTDAAWDRWFAAVSRSSRQ